MRQAIDVNGLAPEAQPIALRVAGIYLRYTGDAFVGLVTHGSAVKRASAQARPPSGRGAAAAEGGQGGGGQAQAKRARTDFIPNVSDLDFELYVRPALGDSRGPMPLEIGLEIQRELAAIDPAPFAYIQGYVHADAIRAGWIGPVPGAYTVIAGRLPIAEAAAAELAAAARRDLAEIPARLASLPQGLLDTGRGSLERRVRLLLTDVWPALRQVVALQTAEAIAAWQMTKEEAIDALEGEALRTTGRAVHEAAWALSAEIDSLDAQLAVMQTGADFLAAAGAWAIRDIAPD